jgi:hypothetical protein
MGCNTTTTNLSVSTTVSPVSYSWTGSGIVGGATSSVVTVNLAGTYTCQLSSTGCPITQVTVAASAVTNTAPVLSSITPSGNVCVPANSNVALTAVHGSTNDIILWSGPSSTSYSTETIMAALPGTYTVLITDPVTGCTGSDLVTIAYSPTVSLSASTQSICTRSTNGSQSTVTLTPVGAQSYTLFTTPNFSTSTPNGTSMSCFYVNTTGTLAPVVTVTLQGVTGTCKDLSTISVSVIANPTIASTLNSYSICPGQSQMINVSGAANYSWTGSPGLNSNSGSNVIASPVSTGIYSVMGSLGNCNSSVETFTVVVRPTPALSAFPMSSTICLGSTVGINAAGTGATFQWLPVTGLISPNSQSVVAAPLTTQTYSVVASLNTCTNMAIAVVNVVQPPVITVASSAYSICNNNYNSSPVSLSFSAGGATY